MYAQDIDFMKNGNNGDEVTNPASSIDGTVKFGNTSSNKDFGDSQSQSIPTPEKKKVKNEEQNRAPVIVNNNDDEDEIYLHHFHPSWRKKTNLPRFIL